MSIFARALKSGSFPEFWPDWAGPDTSRSVSMEETAAWLRLANSSDGALRIGAVFASVSLIANTLATLPLALYRRVGDDERERAIDRPEYAVLHDRVNPQMTSFGWRQTSMAHLLLWGNCYSEIERDAAGRLVALYPLRPDRMSVREEDGRRVYVYSDPAGGQVRLPSRKVFHIPALSPDGRVGYSVISLMRDTLGSYTAARDFGSSFFRNGARPAMVVTHPKTMSPGAVDRLTAQMDKLRGAGNQGKTVLIEEGGDFKEIGIPPEDAQYMETKRFEIGEIARWFGVPPHMIGDVERSTSWGTGIAEQKQGFIDFTMAFHFANWTSNISSQLLWDIPDDLYAEFVTDAFLKGNTLERYQAYQIGRNGGWLNPNAILRRENMPPRDDPGGEEYLVPSGFGIENGPPPEPSPAPSLNGTFPLVTNAISNGR